MELSEQSRSRLEETKVEKLHDDQEYLRKHPEIAAAFRLLSKVKIWEILKSTDGFFFQTLLTEQPDGGVLRRINDMVLDPGFEEKVRREIKKEKER